MGKNHFTEEQQSELQKNPYIKTVSAKSISYTKEFKEKFQEEYRAGKLPSQILADMGIDHRILGKKRKYSLVARMKQYELRPEGCEDTRKNNTGRPSTKGLTDAEKIKRLEQKIAYLNQGPGMILLTDITYLCYNHGDKAYLSAIKDACTNR